MNSLKKLLSVLIALAMLVTFTVPAWAADENTNQPAEETEFNIEKTIKIERKASDGLKTSYKEGEKLDLSKLVLTFTDENGNTKDFNYEDLKAMGFNFALCGEDFKTDEEKAAEELAKALEEAKKTAEEETAALTNLNDTEKAEFKATIEAATDEEAINKVKAEAKLKDDFIGAANEKFSRIKDKEGVYTSEYNPTNRTVNVKILDKTKGARQISGTGLVANLFDLYKNNKLVKLQIGENRDSQSGEIQVLDLNALAELAKSTKPEDQDEDNAIMNQFAFVIGAQLLSSVQKEGNNTGTLADFIDQSVDIKAIVLDGDIETEAVFKVNGIDGTSTPEEPGIGGGGEETLAPTDTCTPVENIDGLKIEDNGKQIVVTGPQTLENVQTVPDLIKFLNFRIATITVEKSEEPGPQPGGDEDDDKPGQNATRPFNPGFRYEPSPHYLKDTARREEKPAERREEKKEENKDTKGDILRVLYFYLDKGFYEMEVNGEIQQIPMDVASTAINQRTMLPIRFVAEAIGATVEWHQDTQSATFTKDGITATITLGSNIIQVSDGRQIVMDAEPTVIAERIFVPLTNISQIFGMTNGDLRDGKDNDIEWDQENYRVIITVREN